MNRDGKRVDRVKLGFISYPVRKYIAPPLRCYKCQRYGHIATVCKAKTRCARCGGEHEFGKCEEGVGEKCCNCGGKHNAAYGGCEVRRKAVEIQQEKVKQNISYAEAVKAINNRNKDNKIEGKEIGRGRNDEGSIPEKTMLVNKRNFVLFMVEVINCTAQTERRSEKIQIIVKAASKFLEIKGLTWEEIRDGLSSESQSSQESCAG